MKNKKSLALVCLLLSVAVTSSYAFCGFYVSKADTQLFNKASKVVIVRDKDRTVLTMANDFQGDPTEFAIVIPVPTFLEKDQIHVTDNKYIDHLDAYTSPRLVEYFDEDPCRPRSIGRAMMLKSAEDADARAERERSNSLGVTIEAEYTIGEYDIKILSAEQSNGLETWLRENGYRPPKGASRVLASYIKQKMRFFVAQVNLAEQSKLGYTYLRPLQVAYESPKFMLPVRLGTLNAKDYQELFVFLLSKEGRVETTNYRTVKIPSNVDIPVYIKDQKLFADFYRAMFATSVGKENMRAVFLEYAWDMAWCDPCAADPLNRDELRELGVFWLDAGDEVANRSVRRPSPAQNVYVTRLHLRYTADTFPEDLAFQQTGDRQNFQGRYVMRHPWRGESDCPAAVNYRRDLPKRMEERAQNLARLTGWDINKIRDNMSFPKGGPKPEPFGKTDWWKKLWNK